MCIMYIYVYIYKYIYLKSCDICIHDIYIFFHVAYHEHFCFFKETPLFIYLFNFGFVGLRFCARAFRSCGKRGPLFIAVRGPLIIAASLVAEHRLQTRRLSNCGSRA